MMKVCERTVCSFQNWYPKFCAVTCKSFFEVIPSDVLNYLIEDGIVLPIEASKRPNTSQNMIRDSQYESIDWSSDSDDSEVSAPSFPDFSEKLQSYINLLGGNAFIKLNWSAPTDASWIVTNKSLNCSTIEDVYLLLKSSDRIAENLAFAYKNSPGNTSLDEYCVVLREWKDIHPGSEFRCFVAHDNLFAITQRDCTEYHKHIIAAKFDIIDNITAFFKNHIKRKFSLTRYVFDVVRYGHGLVELIDFGVFNCKQSKPYLFNWAELVEMSDAQSATQDVPEFRFIGEETGIQPNLLHHFGVPQDLVHLCEDRSSLSLMDYAQTNVATQNDERL